MSRRRQAAGAKGLRGPMMWVAADSALSFLSAMAIAFLVAPIIGPVAFGMAGSAYLLVTFAEAFIGIPIGEALIQRTHYSNSARDTGFTLMMGLGIALFAVMVLAAPLVADFFGAEEIRNLVYVQALTCPLLALRGVPEAIMARKLRFRSLAIRNSAAKLVSVVVALALAFAGWGAWAVIVSNVSFALVSTVLVLMITPRIPRLRFSAQEARSLSSFAGLSLTENVMWVATPRVFAFLIGRFQGLEALGLINIAFRINDALVAVVSALTSRVALPILSRARDDADRMKRAFLKGTELCSMLSLPIFTGLALVSGDVVLLVMGPEWERAGIALMAVSLFSTVNFAMTLTQPSMKAVGRPDLLVWLRVVGLTYIGTSMWFLADASFFEQLMVWACFGILHLAETLALVRLALGIAVVRQVGALARPVIAALVMAAVTAVLQGWAQDVVLILRLGIAVVGGAAAYALISIAINRKLLAEIVNSGPSR
ncbi:oligosaccharide flippase family protein [Croceicoccus mobilis]|uniref:Lipopolysaccharide biosynthesis protein n=1 Tax=Croceicoccus mobilis TaxID=1703339 RepID=A0A917DT11_9SPHN|nr:oligosaccharide flippase family protein [Croceicoccus mobilis]GGD65959.1 hypothetical protein GCM10010990_14310 [Croceicoccus mobilis]